MDGTAELQRAVCRDLSAEFDPSAPDSRVGIALQTLDLVPINGVRIAEHGTVCGWYLWGGESTTEDEDFYQPMCVEHLAERCPLALPFLGLPEGWRFLTDGRQVEVWYDPELVRRG